MVHKFCSVVLRCLLGYYITRIPSQDVQEAGIGFSKSELECVAVYGLEPWYVLCIVSSSSMGIFFAPLIQALDFSIYHPKALCLVFRIC